MKDSTVNRLLTTASIVGLLLGGFLMGSVATYFVMSSGFQSVLEIQSLMRRSHLQTVAYKQYAEGSPCAIHALQAVLDESIDENTKTLRPGAKRWDVALTYARLWHVSARGGSSSESAYLARALEEFSKQGWVIGGASDLQEALRLIDEGRVRDAVNSVGRVDPSMEKK